MEWVPLVEQLGGQLVSDDGKSVIVGDQAWIKVLDFMKAWGPHGKNLGSPTYKPARSLFNFDKNEIAMANTGLYQQGRMRTDNAAFFASKDWSVIPFPQFKNAARTVANCYYGHYYMVNAQKPARNQSTAWKFIGYMLSHPEEYLEKVSLPQPTKKLMASKAYTDMPYSKVFTDDMAKAHIVYYGANSAKLQELIKTAVESVMLNNVPSDKALETLKKDAQDLFAGEVADRRDEGRDRPASDPAESMPRHSSTESSLKRRQDRWGFAVRSAGAAVLFRLQLLPDPQRPLHELLQQERPEPGSAGRSSASRTISTCSSPPTSGTRCGPPPSSRSAPSALCSS